MKPVLVDSNVLIDIFSDHPSWYQWSRNQLTRLYRQTRLYINPVVYAEISVPFKRIEELETCLQRLPLQFAELPKEALFLAAKAFLQYRQKGGAKTAPLPDFYIGAHAAVKNWQLITRDTSRIKHYFPSVPIISPESTAVQGK
ncbi:MAG: type II toxin-antitoxin system VapC family toxin [Deltaproteobacteria bacterium]|nr:type II toxin-antitoxin system VapC family toxin [Deltaproteobacteria bacterium]